MRGVIGVLTIRNGGKSAIARQSIHLRKEFRFAIVAPIRRVAHIPLVVKLLRRDDFDKRAKRLCDGKRVCQRPPWKTRTVGDNAEH